MSDTEYDSLPGGLIGASRRLAQAVDALGFGSPVSHVYNPLHYARDTHEEYLRRFAHGPKRVVFLGMNPGPWGMAQTGVPFGEVTAVRDWMRIDGAVGRPAREHPKRPIEGLSCSRSEVSGRRLWGLMARRFDNAESFFASHFVANYCPLVFMEESGRNRTPDKLPRSEREPLFAACDQHLAETVRLLEPEFAVGVGKFAEAQLQRIPADAGSPRVLSILHPSPASPRANKDWAGEVIRRLEDAGVW